MLPKVYRATDLEIDFPEKSEYVTESEAEKTRKSISEKSVFTPDGQTYIDKESLPSLLATDKKGAARAYLDANTEDKLELGEKRYLTTSRTQYEISKRIEEPRDTLQIERLKDSEKCLIAYRDHPDLEKRREVEESKIRKELPNLKAKKQKIDNVQNCELTGDSLEKNAAVHHKERRADKPRLSLDEDNLLLINPEPHKEIHKVGAESKEELLALSEERGWKKQ